MGGGGEGRDFLKEGSKGGGEGIPGKAPPHTTRHNTNAWKGRHKDPRGRKEHAEIKTPPYHSDLGKLFNLPEP